MPGWLGWLSVQFNFCSGHDLTVHGFQPCTELCADSAESAWDSLSLSAPRRSSISKINKLKKIKINKGHETKRTSYINKSFNTMRILINYKCSCT